MPEQKNTTNNFVWTFPKESQFTRRYFEKNNSLYKNKSVSESRVIYFYLVKFTLPYKVTICHGYLYFYIFVENFLSTEISQLIVELINEILKAEKLQL